ncbi:MAG: hypothetical protein IJZ79_03570 [Bacilli bacterium]|nr:hypothetical protein [Bacilli bacterium]MBQ8218808.1 hypothetical protein [Bacilli bacterium]
MRVKDVRMSVSDHGLIGYCPNCDSMIMQKTSKYSCRYCNTLVEYTKTQELVEDIRKELLESSINKDKINDLLNQIIDETGK